MCWEMKTSKRDLYVSGRGLAVQPGERLAWHDQILPRWLSSISQLWAPFPRCSPCSLSTSIFPATATPFTGPFRWATSVEKTYPTSITGVFVTCDKHQDNFHKHAPIVSNNRFGCFVFPEEISSLQMHESRQTGYLFLLFTHHHYSWEAYAVFAWNQTVSSYPSRYL